MPTHSSILAWEIPWTEEPDGLHSMGSQRDITECMRTRARARTHTHTHPRWRGMACGRAAKTLELDPGFTSSVTSENL